MFIDSHLLGGHMLNTMFNNNSHQSAVYGIKAAKLELFLRHCGPPEFSKNVWCITSLSYL